MAVEKKKRQVFGAEQIVRWRCFTQLLLVFLGRNVNLYNSHLDWVGSSDETFVAWPERTTQGYCQISFGQRIMFRMALGCLFDPTCFLLLCRISLDLYNCIGVLWTRPRCIMDEHRVSNCVTPESAWNPHDMSANSTGCQLFWALYFWPNLW